MRTERQQLQMETVERTSVAPEVVPAFPKPSTNGHKAPAVNGNGAHHGTVDIHILHTVLDWDGFLPQSAETARWRIGQTAKRAFDFVAASLILLALLPLFAVVAVVIKLTSKGPVFYVCDYVGYRGRRFPGYKFRTMVADAEAKKVELNHLNHMKGPAFKIRDDPRITGVGKILRKYSIDELPQLWNVVKGDMSLVGPRPPLPEEWVEYKDWHRAKLSVIPGITCYWQINGRSEITDFDEWARLDLRYIDEWSLWTDLKILAGTVPAVLKGHGAY